MRVFNAGLAYLPWLLMVPVLAQIVEDPEVLLLTVIRNTFASEGIMHRDAAVRVRWWLVGIGIANFIAFVFVSLLLGGDALNGSEVNGRYFVAMHGYHREVTRSVFLCSWWHGISVIVTSIATLVGGIGIVRAHFGGTPGHTTGGKFP